MCSQYINWKLKHICSKVPIFLIFCNALRMHLLEKAFLFPVYQFIYIIYIYIYIYIFNFTTISFTYIYDRQVNIDVTQFLLLKIY